MARCPEGHESEATDYCDICGSPIGASSAGSAGPHPAAAASGAPGPGSGSVLELDEPVRPTQTCPHCSGVNVADALFCEACGYDFTTGAAPLGDEPASPPVPEPADDAAEVEEAPPPEEAPADEGSEEIPEPTPEPEATPRPEPASEPEPTPAPAPAPESPPEREPTAPEPEPEVAAAPDTPQPEAVAHARPRHTPPSRDLADTWVVEIWVDPDWYAVQQTAEACPSAGVPGIVVVRRSVVTVGRPSGSLGVRPEIDAGADSAVSRRHAQLTSDGSRWWIEDLDSSNGTYVGVVGEPLPTQALTPGQRVEIDRDDRIYVGAWTRLVLRQATAAEQAGQG